MKLRSKVKNFLMSLVVATTSMLGGSMTVLADTPLQAVSSGQMPFSYFSLEHADIALRAVMKSASSPKFEFWPEQSARKCSYSPESMLSVSGVNSRSVQKLRKRICTSPSC